jgi:hypothetical protein
VEGCLTIEFKYNDICIEIDADHLENWLAGDGIDWGVKYEGEKVVRERSVAKQCGKRATISREEDSRELCGDEDFENQAEHIQCKTQSV